MKNMTTAEMVAANGRRFGPADHFAALTIAQAETLAYRWDAELPMILKGSGPWDAMEETNAAPMVWTARHREILNAKREADHASVTPHRWYQTKQINDFGPDTIACNCTQSDGKDHVFTPSCMWDDNPAVSISAGDYGQPVGPKCARHTNPAALPAGQASREDGHAPGSRSAVFVDHVEALETNPTPSGVICGFDDREFPTMAALTEHFAESHKGQTEMTPDAAPRVVTVHVSRDGLAIIANGMHDGAVRLQPTHEGINVTVQAAAGTFPTLITITKADALQLALDLAAMASRLPA